MPFNGDYFSRNLSVYTFSPDESWAILSPIAREVKRKVEEVGTPLKDWNVEINYGIKTGNNDVFILKSSAKRNEILSKCITEEERARTAEIIRPILRGRNIKKYRCEWADEWIVGTFPSRKYNIDDYPALKNYLLSFGMEALEQSGKTHIINGVPVKSRKKTNNKWFETQDSIAYWDNFSQPKIIYPNMTKFFPFCLDKNGFFTNDKCFFITGVCLGYLTAFFNSSLFRFCFKESFPGLQGEARELRKVYFEKIPVRKVDTETNARFEQLVDKLQSIINQKPLANKLENEINNLIFKLYDLDEKEIEIIRQG